MSTSPVGTTENIYNKLILKNPDLKGIKFAYCPERVLPGNIINEMKFNSHIVGGVDKKSTNYVYKLYKSFLLGEIVKTDSKTAEFCKLAENAYRDTNIALANDLSKIGQYYSLNMKVAINIANMHPRVNILDSGIGVGGHCIPIDPWFLLQHVKNKKNIIRTSREINNNITNSVFKEIRNKIKITKRGKKLLFLGVTYKENVSDIRESPAIKIISKFKKYGFDVLAFDPHANSSKSFITFKKPNFDDYDYIIILVKHQEFLKFKSLQRNYKSKIIDVVGIFDSQI